VKRWCACGKRNMPNQPCHLQEAHCGLVCGKKLKCGFVRSLRSFMRHIANFQVVFILAGSYVTRPESVRMKVLRRSSAHSPAAKQSYFVTTSVSSPVMAQLVSLPVSWPCVRVRD
jgi:hypothetical protein